MRPFITSRGGIARIGWAASVTLAILLGFSLSGCGPSPESRRLIKRLDSGPVAERLKAIGEIQGHADPAVRAELLRLFENSREPPLIRSYAGISLGSLHDSRIVLSAVKQLPDAIVTLGKPGRPTAMEPYLIGKALTAYGPEALPTVAVLLRDPRREVVTWAILHHGSYRHSDVALEVLARYLDSRDVIFRQSAAFGVSMLAHKRAEELVLRHLADPDAEVRYNLAWALLNYGSAQGIRPLETQIAAEKEPRVRQEMTKALAMMKTRVSTAPPAAARKP